MISIIFQGMGLRYISASVSMMLSGSCIIFTAILSVSLLKCRLNNLHLSGSRLLPLFPPSVSSHLRSLAAWPGEEEEEREGHSRSSQFLISNSGLIS